MINFTSEDLQKYNGEQDNNAYVVHNDIVYDLSGSQHWKDGVHMQAHHAGMDLTKALNSAPHGPEVLINFPVVGMLVVEKPNLSRLQRYLSYSSDLHAHSIFSHFTVSSFVLSPLFLLAHLFSLGTNLVEIFSFYLMIIGLVSLPFSLAAGLLDWWTKHSLAMTGYFKKKLVFSMLLALTAIACFTWRFTNTSLILERQSFFQVYVCFNISLMFYAVILGRIGGKLVFPTTPLKFSPKRINKGMIDVLSAAIPREKETYEFYKKLEKLVDDPSQKIVFDFLAHEEKIHEAKLQQMIDGLMKQNAKK